MARNSIQSIAFEKKVSVKEDGLIMVCNQIFMRYGLFLVIFFLIGLFSVLTDTFFSKLTFLAIISEKSVIALLALAATITMIAGKINLNVGFGVTLWHVLAITFQQSYGLSWQTATIIVVLLGCAYGFINGFLVAFTNIDSFVATLGTGTIIYAISLWHTSGRQVVGVLPEDFFYFSGLKIGGIPMIAYYLVIIVLVTWIISEYLPLGRSLYAVGANEVTAELNGIKVKSYYMGAYIVSDGLVAFTSVLIASHIGIGSSSIGQDYMLPALVGAFLGSTTIRPGRVNILGTMVGVTLISVGIAGLQQLGAQFYVEPLFNGTVLILSLLLAGYGQNLIKR